MPDCFSKSEVTDFLNFMKLPDGTSIVSDGMMKYLTERRQTMTDDLVAHAPVADEADSERAMLNDSFVTTLDNAPDELLC